jgi:hypothetical protein
MIFLLFLFKKQNSEKTRKTDFFAAEHKIRHKNTWIFHAKVIEKTVLWPERFVLIIKLAPSASALGELLQSFIRSQSPFLSERLRVLLLRQAKAFSCELHLTLFNLM